MPIEQPEAVELALQLAVSAHADDVFRLAALHQTTTLTGSLLMALALRESKVDAAKVWADAHLDEASNEAQWGRDAEAEARLDKRYRDFAAAALYLQS